MVFNKRWLIIVCIALITYSVIGGLLLPLSTGIQSVETVSQSDSFVSLKVTIPQLAPSESKSYLFHQLGKNKYETVIEAKHMERHEDTLWLDFVNPNSVAESKKGSSIDLMVQNNDDGSMVYFGVMVIDTPQALYHDKKSTIDWASSKKWLSFPNRPILNESIRNLFFHVPMWFAMISLLLFSLIRSIRFLSNQKSIDDIEAHQSVIVGLVFGSIGIVTGMIWAKYTWGTFWTSDPKLNGAAIGMLSYLAYIILRGSIEEPIKRAKISAVYNIFSFTIYIVFIFILPKINDSLHPGNGGNPAFNIYDQDHTMRLFFYPAVAGWILFAFWLKDILVRIDQLKSSH
jgi:heme exporter protein C